MKRNCFFLIVTRIRKVMAFRDLGIEMANKPVPVGIARTCPRFDEESPH